MGNAHHGPPGELGFRDGQEKPDQPEERPDRVEEQHAELGELRSPSMTPAATAPSHDGLFMYLQKTYVAATPNAVEPRSVVISRQCAGCWDRRPRGRG